VDQLAPGRRQQDGGVILGTLLSGPGEFSELKRAVAGISDSVLSARLAELGRAGLVQRPVDEGPPVAVSYALTPAGQALLPALRELTTWAPAPRLMAAATNPGTARSLGVSTWRIAAYELRWSKCQVMSVSQGWDQPCPLPGERR